jgi:hypothetical protein
MIWSKTKERLAAGETLVGHFGPAGSDDAVPGIIRWSAEDGALLELIEHMTWPGELGGAYFTVHGAIEEGDAITLPDAWVKTTTMGDRVKRITGATLLLGEHVEPSTRWPRAILATANLAEWRGTTGLSGSRPNRRKRPGHFRIDWQPPEGEEVAVRGAKLRFFTESKYHVGKIPSWSIETQQKVVVDSRRPCRIDVFERDYTLPPLALTAFAADRPDGIIDEIYFDPDSGRRVEAWRAGRLVTPRDWHPNGFLFRAAELPVFARSVRRWWRLYERVRPALGIFGDHINERSTYSRSRLLTVHTAISAYSDTRHGHRRLRKLRDFAGVSNDATGCSNDALALFGASRNYFAHLGKPQSKFSIAEMEDGALHSTRRAAALMQACLLRELGFSSKRAAELLRDYYASWPL